MEEEKDDTPEMMIILNPDHTIHMGQVYCN